MVSLSEIRADLREIRYFYSRQKIFADATKIVGSNSIVEKAQKYNDYMKNAPVRLCDLYIGLYVRGLTQEALAVELGYTPEYVQMIHKQLLLYLQEQMK